MLNTKNLLHVNTTCTQQAHTVFTCNTYNTTTRATYRKRLKLTGSGGHVTLAAQNRAKLNCLLPCRAF